MATIPKIGVDAGGTLVKIAFRSEDSIQYHKIPSSQLTQAALWINEHRPEAIVCLTGGKSRLLASMLERDARHIPEFAATCRGIRHLLHQGGMGMPSFLLTNVGTGTSIHYLDADSHARVGGTGIGGGTVLGLSYLLTGLRDYESIVKLAGEGVRSSIDLTVAQIYEGAVPPLAGDLTASNFGNIDKFAGSPPKKEDLIASVIGFVGETVATVSAHAGGQYGTADIVFIGSSFADNDPLRNVVEKTALFRGANPYFVENGEYSGALGALMAIG
ncbi:type II pantothenate kinase [Paenibacillus sp. CECT 9249]|uniref:type II pantothenate kinase n=1 Tax=unclassified Paenibacillus TaxID=185978 RepID=UPI001C11D407|nr:type II pantothenate kinase [Paenibacillus sp. CECT 9249]MBU5444890.1 type II pantothenate kinase [Paenibacillus sp. MSJ-34]CAH0121756.1 Type II pantothenate kinase [Paenibacillus sp. CECT 9249]